MYVWNVEFQHFILAIGLQSLLWDYTLGMGRFPTPWLTSFNTSDALFWEGQGERGRGRKRGRDRRMIEWGGCRGREWQSGDGKWQYNMIWFVAQNGFSVPIFWERGDGERGEGGRGRQRWVEEVGGVWTAGPWSSFSTGAMRWLDSCWWRH